MQIRQADQHMPTSLRGIAKKAKEDPKHRFGNLYSLLNEANLRWCFPQLNRKAAPGVDGIDWQVFWENLDGNIEEIALALREKRYKARLVRRSFIPKSGGKLRPLGIPVIADKLVQTAATFILNAIFERDFLPCFQHRTLPFFEKGAAIESGQTVKGIQPDSKWGCQFEDSLLEPKRELLDINLGKRYAAGNR